MKNMFKLFNTPKAQPRQSEKEVEVIEEIHNAFDIASDKALAQAKQILSANEISKNKAEHVSLLLKAGFSSAKQVSETEDIRRKRQEATRRAETVSYFQQRYPQYKFIFADQVDAICKKYGLICAEISRYIGEVPNKNLKEIIDFKILEDDIMVQAEYGSRWGSSSQTLRELVESSSLKTMEAAKKEEAAHEKWVKENYTENERTAAYSNVSSFSISELSKYICAPVGEMRVYAGEEVKNNKIVSVPDPIVLQIVKGGFLVVSKWGIEAQDDSLTNEVMN